MSDSEQKGHEAEIEPDVQALMDEFTHDLEHNPAIGCPITFNWSGNQDLADYVGIKIRILGLVLRKARPESSFSALKGITFHHDYEQGLRDVSGSRTSDVAPTKEAGGLSVGMMLRVDGGAHLVMHECVALALASDDDAQTNWAEQIIRHELFHVDDYAFKSALITKRPDASTYHGFDFFAAPLAEALWDEFYANKYSYSQSDDPRIFFDLLRDSVPSVRKEVIDAIIAYRSHRDLEVLLAFVRPKIKFVAQCFGYAAGVLAALGTSLEKHAPDEYAMLQKYGLSDAWHQCFDAVFALDSLRPDWESVLEIKRLFPGCFAIFSGFGLHHHPYGEGAYVSVPFTAETTPALAK